MHKTERKLVLGAMVVLLVTLIAYGISCKAKSPTLDVESGTFLTVREPGANMHTSSDVKSKDNVIKDGAIFPGIEVKVLDTEVVAYKVMTRAMPDKPSRTGWIYAGLVKTITNR